MTEKKQVRTGTLIDIISAVLNCWYLDSLFITEMVEEYDLDIFEAVETTTDTFGKINCNNVIYGLLQQRVGEFIENNKEELQKRWINTEVLQEELQDSIYTNWIDSGFDYENPQIQDLLNEFWM